MNSAVDAERFVRQMMLVEVGVEGQRAIGRCEPMVSGTSLAHEIASRYALGAGALRVLPGPIEGDEADVVEIVVDESARAVLAGSRAALREIRKALATP